MYRKSMSRAASRKSFRRSTGTHPMNFKGTPMRGGIRL